MGADDGGRERRLRAPAKLALALGVLVVALGLGEGAWRVVLRARGEPYDRRDAIESIRLVADQMTRREATRRDRTEDDAGEDEVENEDEDAEAAERRRLEQRQADLARHVLHPFLAYETVHSFQQIEEDGAYFATPRAREAFDVLILGGSVAAIFNNTMSATFADMMAKLPALEGREVRVFGYARGSYKQPQQVIMLAWLLTLGYRPDLVLNLDGFNEVAQSNVNATFDAHPLYPSFAQWAPLARGGLTDGEALDLMVRVRQRQVQALALAERAESSPWLHSAIAGRLWLGQARRLQRRFVAAQGAYQEFVAAQESLVTRGPVFEHGLDRVIQTSVKAWAEGSRSLHDLCAARGILYLGVLQPTLHDEGAKPVTQEELASGTASQAWLDAVRVGYPLLRSAGRALRRDGVAFTDATRLFQDVEQTLYYDACHFGARGNVLLAKRLTQAVRRVLAGEMPGTREDADPGGDEEH